MNISEKILSYIDSTDFGASASQISKAIGHNRITVSKYLEILKAQGSLGSRGFAQARIWNKNAKSGVLIVDDEPHIVNLIKMSLDSQKYDIRCETSGPDALMQMEKDRPDLLILDLMMPKVSGYDVMERMKRNPELSKVPIIVLSAKSQLDDKLKAVDLGADDYLTKPFDPLELSERVKVMLSPHEKEQQLHPVTNLLKEKAILSWVDRKIKSDENFEMIVLTLKDLSLITESKGVKSKNEVMVLISKLLGQIVGKYKSRAVLGHTNNDNLIIVRETSSGPRPSIQEEDLLKEIKDEISKLLPFIYHDNKVKRRLSVKAKVYKDISPSSMFDILR